MFHPIELGPTASRKQLIDWWESRRQDYNKYLGLTGVVSLILVMVAGTAAMEPGADFGEPIALLMGPGLYLMMANIFYTLGWIFDITFYRASPRKGLYKFGLIFSVVLTALPGLSAVIAWLITIHTGKRFTE